MTKRETKLLLVILVLSFIVLNLVSLSGCATSTVDTPRERATQLMSIYNNQYELYLREAAIEDLTEEKKEVLREKKKLMTELYPYIGLYAEYADKGVSAPIDVEMAVMAIMDKLLGL